MKKLFALLTVLFFSLTVMAEETKTLKYSCLMDKSDTLNLYEVNTSGRLEISIQIDNFLTGEAEVARLNHPFIVNYGNVYMVTQNYGRSGYFFIRFEDGKKAAPHDIGNSLGMIDDNRFLGHSIGYNKGALSALANCSKNQN